MDKKYEKRLRASIEYHYSIRGEDPIWVHDVVGNCIGIVHIWMSEGEIEDQDAPLIVSMFHEIAGINLEFFEDIHRFDIAQPKSE